MTGPPGCGGCTLCCTVMRVEMDPPKPALERCRHCIKGGCAIYEARPEPCRVWSCLWLHSQAMGDRLPSNLRPDRCGVVLNLNSAGTILAHCASPAAWQGDAIRRWLVKRAARITVILILPAGVLLLKADGTTEPLRDSGYVDPATNERRYVRAGVGAAARG